jgi:hypothetical protein
VRLVNVVYGFMTINRLWGKVVRLDEWMEYSGDELRKKFRPGVWWLTMARTRRLTRFEIEGIDEQGRQVPLSRWRLKQLEREPATVVFRDADAIAGELQGISGLGGGELAYHLRDHEGLSPSLSVRVLHRLGYADVNEANLAKKRGDGQGRARRGMPCRACPSVESGQLRKKSEAMP